jgi:hypothetical protein
LKVYIESSVLTDWLFLETVEFRGVRGAVGLEAKRGHSLFNSVLRGKYKAVDFATSSWAVSESIQNYLRSFAMFNMLLDNLSLRYFEAVRDYRRYKMPERDFSMAKQWFLAQLEQARERKRLTLVSRRKKPEAIHKYLYMGFDAVDAQHLVEAIDEFRADILVTKDRDFHDRKKEIKKKHHIDILHPSETILRLKR